MDEILESNKSQKSLFNLNGRELNPNWIDPNQPLFIPDQPLHYRAHKLQIMVHALEKQAVNNPAQFNSKNFREMLAEYTACVKAIKDGLDEIPNERTVVDDGDEGTASEMGDGTPSGVDSRVSADNPFSGQGVHTSEALPIPS